MTDAPNSGMASKPGRARRFWMQHWGNPNWRNDINHEYERIDHTAGSSFRRRGVSAGDLVYIVSLRDGQLLFGGRMTVKRIASMDEAVRHFGTDNLWDASEHLIGEAKLGTPLNLHRQLAPAVSRRLRFISKGLESKGLFFVSATHLSPQTTRGAVRELTPESAALLEQIIEITDRLPKSGEPIVVTEKLLRKNLVAKNTR